MRLGAKHIKTFFADKQQIAEPRLTAIVVHFLENFFVEIGVEKFLHKSNNDLTSRPFVKMEHFHYTGNDVAQQRFCRIVFIDRIEVMKKLFRHNNFFLLFSKYLRYIERYFEMFIY